MPTEQFPDAGQQSTEVVRVLPLQRMFDPGAAAVAAGIAHADGSGSVFFDPPTGADPRMSFAAAPPVQRAAESPQTGESAAYAGAVEPSTAAAGPTGAGGAAGPNLEELAQKLFDPLSARLKAELWLDRERAGFVTDLRH